MEYYWKNQYKLNIMKKFLFLILSSFLILSCDEEPIKHTTSKLELRQLVQSTDTTSSSNGWFFLIAGGYESSECTTEVVKVFAKVDGRYRLVVIPIRHVRINIDDSVLVPNVQIEYKLRGDLCTNEEIVSMEWLEKIYVINCPEKYLPEKLLPINL